MPDTIVTPLPPIVATRTPRFVRKGKAIRQTRIRDYIAAGTTDTHAMAKAEGCTAELILFYARQMPDVRIELYQPAPNQRRRSRIVWA